MPPARRHHPQTNSILNSHVVVAQNNNGEPCCSCHLSVKHHQEKSQGSVSLRIMASFEGFAEPESLILWLPLENIARMTTRFNETRIPSAIASQLRRDNSSQPQLLFFDIRMHAPGVVIVPKPALRLTPSEPDRSKVAAFASICQATQVHIFVPTTDQTTALQRSLQTFADAIHTGNITSVAIDLGHARGGRGAKIATSRVFHIAEPPPPYYGDKEGKRIRPESPGSPASPPNKRQTANLSSAGPSANPNPILDPSPSCPPAITDSRDPPHLSADALLELLDTKLETKLRAILPSVLPSVMNAALCTCLTEETLEHALKASIGPLIEDRLPDLVESYIETKGPLDDCLDTATAHFDDHVEDARLEIQMAKNECLDEIGAAREEALKHAQEIVEYVEEETSAAARRATNSQNSSTTQQKPDALLGKGLGGSQDDSSEDLRFYRRRSSCRSHGLAREENMPEATVADAEEWDKQVDGEDVGPSSSPKDSSSCSEASPSEHADGGVSGSTFPQASASEQAGGDAGGGAGGGSPTAASASHQTGCAATVPRDSTARHVQSGDDDGSPNLLGQPVALPGIIKESESSASEMALLTDAQMDPDLRFVPGSTTEADTETDDNDEL